MKKNKLFKPLNHKLGIVSVGILLILISVGACIFLIHPTHKQTQKVSIVKPDFSQQYITDIANKNYSDLWKLYSPDYQKFIEDTVGMRSYVSFLQKKFSAVQFHQIHLSSCESEQSIFPYGVERNHSNSCTTNVSMSLTTHEASASAQLSAFSHMSLILIKNRKDYQIVGGGPTDLQAPVLFPPYATHKTISVPVVMYHNIGPMPIRLDYESDYAWKLDVGLTVTVAGFTSQMNLLQQEGYHPISPNDLFNNLYYDLPIPQKPILLTFDDGRLGDFTYGLPILLSHHYIATYFIPPALTGKTVGYHGHNTYMSFDQLKTLAQDGMFIENHSLYHTKPLWDLPPETLHTQLLQANADLIAYTHYPIQFIAYDGAWLYPTWQQTNPAIRSTIDVLSHMGFSFAFQDLRHNLALEDSFYPYQVPRVRGVDSATISYVDAVNGQKRK